ncbi:MAG: heat shock protein HtpX [Actinomycetota bacterium]|jgi:hypothetical protein|nr:heat shock protein HtpX [Actinomycetota bacterium]
MADPMSSVVRDWNASDADRYIKKPSVLQRISLTSQKSLTRRALKEAGARPIAGSDAPRLHNIASGLGERLGLGRVDLCLLSGDGANALSGRTDRPVVGVTRSLLDGYARTELEAIVAHCLVRHREAGRRGVLVGYSDDVRACALTRYPPALASAIEKAHAYKGRYASFYLVADGPTHRPVKERIEALGDL